jgi:general secretion pathway protein D
MESRTSIIVRKLKRGLVIAPAIVCWSALSSMATAQDHQFRELPPPKNSQTLQPVAPRPIPQPPAVVNAGGTVAADGKIEQVNFWAMAAVRPAASYRLTKSTCEEFERALVQSWLVNPNAQLTEENSKVLVQIPVASGSAMMTIDRKNSIVHLHGEPTTAKSCSALVEAIDKCSTENSCLQVVAPTPNVGTDLMAAIAESEGAVVINGPLSSMFVSTPAGVQETKLPETPATGGQNPQQQNTKQDQIQPNTKVITQTTDDQGQTLSGPVKIQVIPELNAIIITGPPEDVEKVKRKIQEIQQEAKLTGPKFRRIPVGGANVQTLSDTIQDVYDDNYADNLGPASVRPVQDPKGLLVIGREEAINTIENLVKEYDRSEPATPAEPGFKTFRLRFMSAADAKNRVDQYFSQFPNSGLTEPGPAIPVITIADFRSNALVVKGSNSNFEQVELLLKELDVDESPAINMVQVFPLKNSLAENLARPLQDAINGQQQGAGQGFAGLNQQGFNQNQAQNQFGGQNATGSTLRSPSLQLMTVDREGNKVNSGIMFDVRITANSGNNSLIVSAPQSAMPLITTLIEQIDTIPTVETQIKVFQIINGDAQTLLTTMQGIFSSGQTQQGGQGGQLGGGFGQTGGGQTLVLPAQSASATSGMTLGNMRFAIDQRTNSIIVTGPVGDLQVVESLLTRLDEQAFNQRDTVVLRLSNAPVADVATALNAWLTSRQSNIATADPTFASRKFVIVQPEEVSNSIIVSALPEYLNEVVRVIERLDRRPPMLKIKVLLAEVNLSMLEQVGVDLGVQDSLVFDRGIGNIGYPFNQQNIGNNNDALSLAGREKLAGQGLSNLGVGRINSDLGYGGLVLTAGNESINVLLRALQDKQCARILDKPHIMTIENQKGTFQAGQTVARIRGVTTTNFGVTNNIEDQEVGVIIGVTPRISQDGMIILKVDAQKSSLGPVEQGVPVFVNNNGGVIRSPNINKIQIQSTVMARSGQTIVLSGMISEEKTKSQRGAPLLSSLPLIGPLFRFETEVDERRELMLILTPMLVDSEEDFDAVNYDEMDRMHWCLSDVAEVYGSTNYDPNPVYQAPKVYYPDADPRGMNPEEVVPQPTFEEPVNEGTPLPGNFAIPPNPEQSPPAQSNSGQTAAPSKVTATESLASKLR